MSYNCVLIAVLALGVFGAAEGYYQQTVTVNGHTFQLNGGRTEVTVTSGGQGQIGGVLRAYCEANNAEHKLSESLYSVETFRNCVAGLIRDDSIRTDLQLKQLCPKSQQLKACVHGLVTGVTCLPAYMLNSLENSARNLIDFACDSDGARITSFFRENGSQCVQDKQREIDTCQALSEPNAVMAAKGEWCSIQNYFVACVISQLKNCSNPTPARLAGELRKVLACNVQGQA